MSDFPPFKTILFSAAQFQVQRNSFLELPLGPVQESRLRRYRKEVQGHQVSVPSHTATERDSIAQAKS